MSAEEFHDLLERYLSGRCTPEEEMRVERWLDQQASDKNEWQQRGEDDRRKWLASLYADIKSSVQIKSPIPNNKRSVVIRRIVARIAVAASILVIAAVGSYFIFFRNTPTGENVIPVASLTKKELIVPGSNSATITLGDGTVIELDSTNKGTISEQGGSRIIKLDDGRLSYEVTGKKSSNPVINTITTPLGGQYQLILPDGSKVWLNAASSIRFPSDFTGKTRNVEVTGELYFEVSKDPLKPFIVTSNEEEIQVLGTHFNVYSYPDEEATKTTLFEGSVRVKSEKAFLLLKPGQQAVSATNGFINMIDNVDLSEVIAWKDGHFQFEDADIKTVMRQLSRWYNFEPVFKGPVSKHFGGTISRELDFDKVLKILEQTGEVKFTVEGRKVIIESK